MGKAVDDLETLALLGTTQWGLVTSAQAQDAGLTRTRLTRLVERGTLQRVRHGVYSLPSAPSGPQQAVRAAWLAATAVRTGGTTPTAVVSGQSAAVVHGLGEYVPSTYEFTTPTRRQSKQKDISYRVRVLRDAAVIRNDGLPVTTVAQTVSDVAARSADQEQLAVLVADARAAGTSSTSLARALAASAKKAGHADGHTYLAALLDKAGYQPDPEVDAAVSRLSNAVVQAFTPQMQKNMANIIGQMTRRSDQIAASIDPDVISRMVETVSARTDMAQAVGHALSPAAVRQLANAIGQSGQISASIDPDVVSRMLETASAQTNMAQTVGHALSPAAVRQLTGSIGGTLASAQVVPKELAAQEESVDEQATQSDRTGTTASVTEREADGGS